jgi:subtilisin family serine protease
MPLNISSSGDEHDKDIAMAIRYAVDNGAQVINMSFGKESLLA